MTEQLKLKVQELLNQMQDETGVGIEESFFESGPNDIAHDSDREWYSDLVEYFNKNNIQYQFVDNYGGEEQGRDYWSVYSFTDGDNVVYVKFEGWYASYNGSEYEDFYFVEPRQVQVTQFFKAA